MRFQPSPLFSLANKLVEPLIRWGLPMGIRRAPMSLLTVPGRRTGLDRTTPVALERHDDGWLLVAVFGVSDWSRNLDAAATATITSRRKTTAVSVRRLGAKEGGPVLREAILGAPSMIRRMTSDYFAADETSPATAWEKETAVHPIYVLSPITAGQPAG